MTTEERGRLRRMPDDATRFAAAQALMFRSPRMWQHPRCAGRSSSPCPRSCCSRAAAAATSRQTRRRRHAAPRIRRRADTARRRTFVPVAAGNLDAAIQDAAAAPFRGGAVLVGGLTAADVSTDEIVTRRVPARNASAASRRRCTTPRRSTIGATRMSSAAATASRSSTRSWRRPAHRRRPGGRAPAGAELGPGRRGHRPNGVHRRRLHRDALARHDRRLGPGRPRASSRTCRTRCATRRSRPPATLVIAGGSLENGTASDAVYAFARHAPRRPDRPSARADDPRRGRRDRRRRLRDRRPRRGGRHADARIVAVDPLQRTVHVAGASAGRSRISRRSARLAGSCSPAAAVPGDRLHLTELVRAATPSPRAGGRASDERLRGRPRRKLQRGGAARAAARLRPEQRQRHGRRDRPAHIQGRRALRRRGAAAARRARPGI